MQFYKIKKTPFDEGVLHCAEERVRWQTILGNI